jgi:hypothetical protein
MVPLPAAFIETEPECAELMRVGLAKGGRGSSVASYRVPWLWKIAYIFQNLPPIGCA